VNEDGLRWLPTLLFSGAAVCFLIEAAFAVALSSASALSRVALRRLGSDGEERLAFLEGLRETDSSHRIAAHLARQLCLLLGTALVVLGLDRSGVERPLAVGIALAALLAVLLFELCLARLLAMWDPRGALRRTAALIRVARAVLYPLVQPVHLLLARVARLQNASEEQRDEEQDEEVEALIEVGEASGILEANEGEMVRGIVDLDDTVVREIMTPRPDIVALPHSADVDRARRVFLEAGHSRLPVYRSTLDEVIGVLHVQDLLRASEEGNGEREIERFMREAMFVPETLSVVQLLSEMLLRTHIALVVDEYGGTAGLVTLEDVLEEIVGEIREEHEPPESEVRREADGSWLIDAAVHVDKLGELFGEEFEQRDFDTVGGLVVAELGRVPRQGETLQVRSLSIEVLDVDRRRIRLVRVRGEGSSRSARAGS
jgi:CBS domain containing-hemolysin-like protein